MGAVAPESARAASGANQSILMGIFAGEGIGPEVIRAALAVLSAVERVSGVRVERRFGGRIGLMAEGAVNGSVTEDVAEFCEQIFEEGGALLCGPGGGRFVYDLRRRFDLFCKIAPLKPNAALLGTNRLKEAAIQNADVLIVRDNAGGVYQGRWSTVTDCDQGEIARHEFSYSEAQVDRIIEAGARLAATRRLRMHVIIKDGGVPTISDLWRRSARRIAEATGIECVLLNADYAAYRLIQYAQEFDVIVTPNMVGDILTDLGAVLMGSRGLSFSGNFSAKGWGVYQTGHGAAYDLKGMDRANPGAQILSLAMMLRESYGLAAEADAIEKALSDVWAAGWRTEDLREEGCRIVGTQRMGELVAEEVVRVWEDRGAR